MNILVCIKQVPDIEAIAHGDDPDCWTRISETTGFRLNRFDEFAAEEAILIKEGRPETSIDILSVGPPRAAKAIRRALGMGGDNGIHVLTEDEYLSPFRIASWIAAVAGPRAYNLVLTGVMSEDGMHGQVGPMLAELLGIPCATGIIGVELSPEARTVIATREIEGGYRDRLEIALPAVLTIQSGINKPRYPALSKTLRANNLRLEEIESARLSTPEGRERVLAVGYPQKTRSAELLTGTTRDKARSLLDILAKKVPLREGGR